MENLKPFQKGDDERRNLEGRPKKLPELDALLADVLSDEKEGIEAAKAILMALRAKAVKGDVKAAEVLLDRAYGKSKQVTDITTKGESLNKKPDLSKLTTEELETMARIQDKINGEAK